MIAPFTVSTATGWSSSAWVPWGGHPVTHMDSIVIYARPVTEIADVVAGAQITVTDDAGLVLGSEPHTILFDFDQPPDIG